MDLPPPPEGAPKRRTTPWVWGGIALGLVLVIAGGLLLLAGRESGTVQSESVGNATSPSPEPAGVTVEFVVSYDWGNSVPKWVHKDPGADCYDFNFKQQQRQIQILDNADAILAVGEFPEAGVPEWTSATTVTCTWTASLSQVFGESPVYTVKIGGSSETMNADDLADGEVALGTDSGVIWLATCPSSDVSCKRYGQFLKSGE
jgi:hypothetical protein